MVALALSPRKIFLLLLVFNILNFTFALPFFRKGMLY